MNNFGPAFVVKRTEKEWNGDIDRVVVVLMEFTKLCYMEDDFRELLESGPRVYSAEYIE